MQGALSGYLAQSWRPYITDSLWPPSAQVPTDGTISIILQPSGFPVGSLAVVTNTLLGSATATLTVSAERVYGYGAQTGAPAHLQ